MKKWHIQPSMLKKVIIQALKLPILLWVSGLVLSSLQWIESPLLKSDWHHAILIAGQAGNILMGLSVVWFAYHILVSISDKYQHYLRHKEYVIMAQVMLIIKKGLRIIFVLLALNVVVSELAFEQHHFNLINKMIYVIIIAAIAWVLLQLTALIEDILYRKYAASRSAGVKRSSMSYTKFHIIKNILAMIIIVVAIAAALMVFDKVRNIGISLLASAGFLTAVFALAAQKTLSSLFVGLQLLMAQTIEIGDVVVIESDSGVIEEITLTYVVVQLSDRRRWILPISFFIEKPFQNWSRSVEGLSGAVKFFVDYTFPVEAFREALKKVVEGHALWDGRVATVSVVELRENSVELKVMVSAESALNLEALRSDVREQLLGVIQANYLANLPQSCAHR